MSNIIEKLVSAKLARRNYDLGKLAEEYILVLLISEPDESLNLYFKEVLKTLC